MNLDTLISSDAVISNDTIKSKKRALEVLAEQLADEVTRINRTTADDETLAAGEEIDPQVIFQLLTEREKLGSTGMGHGVALPHARTELTDQAIGVFMKLHDGIDFDSPDEQKTDLIFALMVPEHYTDEHLKILSYLATLFSDENFCEAVRNTEDGKKIYDQLIHWHPASKAS
jgi:nitrogen PTS system EIIA component